MHYLRTKREQDALRSYLLDHTQVELGEAIGVSSMTAAAIAKSFGGGCKCRKREASIKLKEVIAPHMESKPTAKLQGSGIDAFGCSKIDSTGAVRRGVLIDLITDKLALLDEEKILQILQMVLQCETV